MKKIKEALIAIIFATTGCGALTYHVEQDPNYRGPKTLPARIEQQFNYRRSQDLPISLEQTQIANIESRLYYTVQTRTFRSYDLHLEKETEITFEYYITKTAQNPPFVLISPILGGGYNIERPLCELLAENGISAALVHRPKRITRFGTYPTLDLMFQSIASDRRKVLDAISTSGQVDISRMGSIGISMGAITNIPLLAVEPRLRYNILGLPGGDIPNVLLESSEGKIEESVEENLQRRNMNRQQLLEFLQQNNHYDPNELSQYVDSRTVRMFLAYFDTVVPYRFGEQVHERMGRPELNVLPTGHYTTALYYFWIRSMVLDFFQENFSVDIREVETRKEQLLEQYRRLHHIKRRVS